MKGWLNWTLAHAGRILWCRSRMTRRTWLSNLGLDAAGTWWSAVSAFSTPECQIRPNQPSLGNGRWLKPWMAVAP